jgi:hypothetical protein
VTVYQLKHQDPARMLRRVTFTNYIAGPLALIPTQSKNSNFLSMNRLNIIFCSILSLLISFGCDLKDNQFKEIELIDYKYVENDSTYLWEPHPYLYATVNNKGECRLIRLTFNRDLAKCIHFKIQADTLQKLITSIDTLNNDISLKHPFHSLYDGRYTRLVYHKQEKSIMIFFHQQYDWDIKNDILFKVKNLNYTVNNFYNYLYRVNALENSQAYADTLVMIKKLENLMSMININMEDLPPTPPPSQELINSRNRRRLDKLQTK